MNTNSAQPLIPTTLVGSYPQPEWLIDRERLSKGVPRVRAPQLWRVAPQWLKEAQDDATVAVIREQERAGLDIVTDGEVRRESYSNHFANALAGIDPERVGHGPGRDTRRQTSLELPLVTGPVRRPAPVEAGHTAFLRANTAHRIKVTLPGPFTMSQQAQNDYYPDTETLAMDFASAVNEEIKDLFAAGADIVQLDEPWMEARPQAARDYGIRAVNRALEGTTGTTALHLCFGYAFAVASKPSRYSFLGELEQCSVQQISIEAAQPKLDLAVLSELPSKSVIVGVLDLGDPTVETADMVARRIEAALRYVPPQRLIVAPDCGMKYLPRATAFLKLKAMVQGAAMVRARL
jgi:5-methyltetrahydropteroyltriglutamate--homocysteine methyltransferase